MKCRISATEKGVEEVGAKLNMYIRVQMVFQEENDTEEGKKRVTAEGIAQ
jgi:hypothetical protein